jgi:hypothetical protein
MSQIGSKEPRFARVWRGRVPRAKADAYQRYWLEKGVKPLRDKGALGVQMLRDDRETETEFVTISYWDSLQSMGVVPIRRGHTTSTATLNFLLSYLIGCKS